MHHSELGVWVQLGAVGVMAIVTAWAAGRFMSTNWSMQSAEECSTDGEVDAASAKAAQGIDGMDARAPDMVPVDKSGEPEDLYIPVRSC